MSHNTVAVQAVNIEQIIQSESAIIASEMNAIADRAQSEEDIRYECNKLLDAFLAKAGIAVRGKHEYGLAGRRVDSKYGGVIIEYKSPHGSGRILPDTNTPGTKAIRKQIEGRFRDFKIEEAIEPNRLFAAGLDGRHILFIRAFGSKFDNEKPQPTTAYTIERLLRALASLGAQGLSFTPENLTEAFGSSSTLAKEGIRVLHDAISTTQDAKALTLFAQWQTLFSEACGYYAADKGDKIGKLAAFYGIGNHDPAALLFALHSYYAIFIKLLAAEIASQFSPLGTSLLKKCAAAATPEKLHSEMATLEQGGIWTQLGIANFLEGDLFAWYLAAWNEEVAGIMRGMVGKLSDFDPTTLSVEPAQSRDLLKKLYHHLFPRTVRHDLGEYYTPDWLAEYTLDEMGYDGDPDKRLLDPACGSGTFLVMAINRSIAWFEKRRHECGYDESELVQKILKNIVGFDLNPLAVMAARTNYLMAIRGLLKFASGIELPVYLCDSILTHKNYSDLFHGREMDKAHVIKTAVGLFSIPKEVAGEREQLGKYTDLLESCIRSRFTPSEFVERCDNEGLSVTERAVHMALFQQLLTLHNEDRDGIWARIIRNAFAPLFVGVRDFDFVAGNPPWVNWESLPDEYRDDMKPLWMHYGLFTLTGTAARLGGGKKDLSMLFVYKYVDRNMLSCV